MESAAQLTGQIAPSGVVLVAALRERIAELSAEVAALETQMTQQYAALAQRQVIAQAMGMLMSLGDCTADKALVLLADRAQSEGRGIHDVAAGMIAAHTNQVDGR